MATAPAKGRSSHSQLDDSITSSTCQDGAVALAEVLRDPCLHSNHVRKERGGGEGKQTGSGASTKHQEVTSGFRHVSQE